MDFIKNMNIGSGLNTGFEATVFNVVDTNDRCYNLN